MNPLPSVESALGRRNPTGLAAKARREPRVLNPGRPGPRPAEATAVAKSPEPPTGAVVDRLLIRDHGQLRVARLEEIEWIEGAGNYVLLHSQTTTLRFRCALGHLAPRLDPRRFVRVHRSAIVNLDHVTALRPRLSGTYDLLLASGVRVSLARSRRRRLLALLGRLA